MDSRHLSSADNGWAAGAPGLHLVVHRCNPVAATELSRACLRTRTEGCPKTRGGTNRCSGLQIRFVTTCLSVFRASECYAFRTDQRRSRNYTEASSTLTGFGRPRSTLSLSSTRTERVICSHASVSLHSLDMRPSSGLSGATKNHSTVQLIMRHLSSTSTHTMNN